MIAPTSYRIRLPISIALISAALIAYQIVIMQILSLAHWFHFAGMVIAVAMLGFGAAGTVLSVFQSRLLKQHRALIPALMTLSGITMTLSVQVSQIRSVRFDSYLLFVETGQWVSLLIQYALFFIPFFLGALALGLAFVQYTHAIGRLYFSNLTGSGIGALMASGFAWYFLPGQLPSVDGLMALFAGLILIDRSNRTMLIPLITLGIFYSGYRIAVPVKLILSEYKSLSHAMDLPSSTITHTRPSPYGLIQVASAEGLRYAPGLSLAFDGEIPVSDVVFVNGEWVGPLLPATRARHFLDFTTSGVAYAFGSRDTVLILHGGTGTGVWHALSKGAGYIDVVEPNGALTDMLRDELAVESDSLFYKPGVRIITMEPRTFAAMGPPDRKYDLIQLPVVGEFGGTAGKYAMREEYALTRESFLQLWSLLDEDGVISVTAWMDYPYKNPLKIAATLAVIAEDREKRSSLAAIRGWGTVTFLLKKSRLAMNEVAQIRAFCDSLYFDPLLLPDLSPEERMVYNVTNDTTFFGYIDDLVYGNRSRLFREYDFHLRPATDDKPYFSQFLRWRSIPRLREFFGMQAVPFFEMGFLIAVVTFVQVTLLALVLIILPLFRRRLKGKGRRWVLLYFGGLGFGYMLLELMLIQRFMLVFGNPVYASALMIGAMLIASGLGSYTSSWYTLSVKNMQIVLMVIMVLLLFYFGVLTGLLNTVTSFPLWLKIIASLLIVGIPAFFMGMPFPLGLRACTFLNRTIVPWAWGINSCCSVISAALAYLLAVQVGFRMVLLLASLSYAISFLACFLLGGRWKVGMKV